MFIPQMMSERYEIKACIDKYKQFDKEWITSPKTLFKWKSSECIKNEAKGGVGSSSAKYPLESKGIWINYHMHMRNQYQRYSYGKQGSPFSLCLPFIHLVSSLVAQSTLSYSSFLSSVYVNSLKLPNVMKIFIDLDRWKQKLTQT
jgi:hypothetical protein